MPRLFGRAPTPRARLVRRSDAVGTGPHEHRGRRESHLLVSLASVTSSPVAPATATLSSAASSLASPSAPGSLLHEVLLAGPNDRGRPSSASTTSVRRDRQQHYRVQRARLVTATTTVDDGRRRSPRKLVKDPSRSARPVASRVLVETEEDGDSGGENTPVNKDDRQNNSSTAPVPTGKGLDKSLRRKMARWRALRFL